MSKGHDVQSWEGLVEATEAILESDLVLCTQGRRAYHARALEFLEDADRTIHNMLDYASGWTRPMTDEERKQAIVDEGHEFLVRWMKT